MYPVTRILRIKLHDCIDDRCFSCVSAQREVEGLLSDTAASSLGRTRNATSSAAATSSSFELPHRRAFRDAINKTKAIAEVETSPLKTSRRYVAEVATSRRYVARQRCSVCF